MAKSMKPKIVQMDLAKITVDQTIEHAARADGIDSATVDRYAEVMKESKGWGNFPHLVIFDDGSGTNWLAEGFHRIAAALGRGLKKAPVELRQGTRREALIAACGSNDRHGLPRTNKDKRRAVETLMKEFPGWSNRRLAEAAAVSHYFVNTIRGQVESDSTSKDEQKSEPTIREGRDGKPYVVPEKVEPQGEQSKTEHLETDENDGTITIPQHEEEPEESEEETQETERPGPPVNWRLLDITDHVEGVSEDVWRICRVERIDTLGSLRDAINHGAFASLPGAESNLKGIVEKASASHGDPYKFATAEQKAEAAEQNRTSRIESVRADGKRFDELADELRSISRRLSSLANSPAGHFLVESLNEAVPGVFGRVKIQNTTRSQWRFRGFAVSIAFLEACKPMATPCLKCSGAGCPQCGHQGWHPSESDPGTRRRLALEAAGEEPWEREAA